jgi:hypothetical protein
MSMPIDSVYVDNVTCTWQNGGCLIPPLDSDTGALPPGDHQATLEEITARLGFTPRRRWLLKGLRAAVEALWAAGVEQIFVDGSFCTEKPDPGDIDGYWVEPDEGVYERIDPYWIDFELVPVPHTRMRKWRMWVDHGVELFIHPAMKAGPELGFSEFFRGDRNGRARGIIQVVKVRVS